jgi:hypothetical protein
MNNRPDSINSNPDIGYVDSSGHGTASRHAPTLPLNTDEGQNQRYPGEITDLDSA